MKIGTPATLLCLFMATLGLCQAQELSLRYTVKALPIPVLADPLINDKGQVAGHIGDDSFFYLPEADYGFEAGIYPRTLSSGLIGMNNTGIIHNWVEFDKHGVLTTTAQNINFGPRVVNDHDTFIGQVSYPDDWAFYIGDGRFYRALDIFPSAPSDPNANFHYGYNFSDINNGSYVVVWRLDLDNEFNYFEGYNFFLFHFAEEPSLQPLPPVGPSGAYGALNDKNQILAHVNEVSGNGQTLLYLPSPDYGLAAGLTPIFNTSNYVKALEISNDGAVFFGGGSSVWTADYIDLIWHGGQALPLKDRLVEDAGTVVVEKINSVSDDGLVLATGTLDGGPRSLLQFTPILGMNMGIDVPEDEIEVGRQILAKVTVSSNMSEPVTVTLQEPLLTASNEGLVEIDDIGSIPPFILSPNDSQREFSVPLRILKKGVADLLASGTALDQGGNQIELEARYTLEVSPVTVDITITNKRHQWKKTSEEDWGERARAINAGRRTKGDEPYENLIELVTEITNDSDTTLENLNIQDARDILGYINSTDITEPAVPLKPIRFYAPDGAEVDLTNPEDPTKVNDVNLPPDETATFAWVVEAFQIDPEIRDKPYQLEFKPLVLASLSGSELKIVKTEPFSIRVRDAIVVNVTSDERDADPEDGVIDVDLEKEGEQISLRAAIEFANEREGLDRIEFDIPGSGVPTIKLGLPPEGTNIMATGTDGDLFPHIEQQVGRDEQLWHLIASSLKATDAVEIDGTTQSAGWVELRGPDSIPLTMAGLNSLEIAGGDSEVRGLVINRSRGLGLVISENGGNLIAGNRIGTDQTGTSALGNMGEYFGKFDDSHVPYYGGGLLISSSNNLIGGYADRDRNLISGNIYTNDFLSSSFGSDLTIAGSKARDNTVVGNYIGTEKTGQYLIGGLYSEDIYGSEGSGILIKNGASNTRLGNGSVDGRNVATAIKILRADGVQIVNNNIGINFTGSGIINRFHSGISISKSSDVLAKDNLIEGDYYSTIDISGSETIRFIGNQIGTFPNGAPTGEETRNRFEIRDSKNILVGGANPGEGNIIAQSYYSAFEDTVEGILFTASSHGMSISDEIIFVGNETPYSSGPEPSAYIIDLNRDGIDEIDFGEIDGKQNYPRLVNVSMEGNDLRMEGNLDSHIGGASYFLDFYLVELPLASGHGGRATKYLGRGTVSTDVAGFGKFDIRLSTARSDYDFGYFAATATRTTNGSTSEFSRNTIFKGRFSTDTDGIGDEQEDLLGDRNGDGVNDSLQNEVASFHTANGNPTTVAVSGPPSPSNVSASAKLDSSYRILADASLSLESVASESEASVGAPDGYFYPNGIITFEISNVSQGATISLRLILKEGAVVDTVWVLNADRSWTSNLPSSITQYEVNITLTDGSAGDRDGLLNGRIVAAIGPGRALSPIPPMNIQVTKTTRGMDLSWPTAYPDAILEYSPDLSSGSWLPFYQKPEYIDGRLTIFLSFPPPELSDPGFYRLRYQRR